MQAPQLLASIVFYLFTSFFAAAHIFLSSQIFFLIGVPHQHHNQSSRTIKKIANTEMSKEMSEDALISNIF